MALRITIEGDVKSGKSIVAANLSRFLAAAGFEVILKDDDRPDALRRKRNQKTLESLAGTGVYIYTKTADDVG